MLTDHVPSAAAVPLWKTAGDASAAAAAHLSLITVSKDVYECRRLQYHAAICVLLLPQ
jgi:hypothetical protein